MKLATSLALLTVLAVGASVTESAVAARPVKGGQYVGFEGRLRDFNSARPEQSGGSLRDVSAYLRVSRDGRRLSSRGSGSYVAVNFACGRDERGFVEGDIDLVSRRFERTAGLATSRPRGPRIRRDGSFRVVRRRGRLHFRLRGRFVSRSAAKLVYSASVPPAQPKNRSHPGRCRTRHRQVALRKDGEPPFHGCADQPATTLVWGPTGRIFMQYRLGGSFFPWVFGCLFETNRRFALARDYDDNNVRFPRLAGPYAAWLDIPYGGLAIIVEDLRTGAHVREIYQEELSSSPTSIVLGPPVWADLALKENGSVGWISVGSAGIEVWAYDTLGRRRLDSGPGIKVGSLTLAGSTLTWVKDGVTRTATLS